MKRHPFAFGVIVGIAGVWVYHHFMPGKGIGQPGSVLGG
jgi:hypothetical protein